MADTTATFVVEGMHCANCGLLIDEVLEDLPGVMLSTTNTRQKRTVVTYDPDVVTPADITAAVDDAGYRATPAEV